jgi:hypothetical protein
MTLLEQATVEHNFLSLARIYKSISFQRLEQLLGIPPEMIEKLATRMISTDLIKGSIDQIERTITFEGELDKYFLRLVFLDQDMSWDDYIVSVCEQISKINDLLTPLMAAEAKAQ